MNNNLLILGAGRYGQVAKEIAESMGCFEKVDLLDDKSETKDCVEKTGQYTSVFVALPNVDERLKLTRILAECGHAVVTLLSPKAYVSPFAKFGAGCMIEPFATVNCGVRIERCCFIGANATIDCGTVVGEGVTVCCGATVIDNTVVSPKTEVRHGQVCYGDAITKRTPVGEPYSFDDVM